MGKFDRALRFGQKTSNIWKIHTFLADNFTKKQPNFTQTIYFLRSHSLKLELYIVWTRDLYAHGHRWVIYLLEILHFSCFSLSLQKRRIHFLTFQNIFLSNSYFELIYFLYRTHNHSCPLTFVLAPEREANIDRIILDVTRA